MRRTAQSLSVALVAALVGCAPARTVPLPVTGAAPAPEGPGRTVSGVAKYEAVDAPHRGITVRLTAPGFQAEATTDDGGRYGFSHLAAGRYDLRFERAGYFAATQSVRLETASASAAPVTLSNHRPIYSSSALYDTRHFTSATSLVLAPGGRLAFVEAGVLKTLPIEGGTPTVVRDLAPPAGTVVDSFDWTEAGLVYSLIEGGATSSVHVTTTADPTGPLQEATRSARLLLCPTFSPDGSEFAYMAHLAEPWTLTGATGSFQLAVMRQGKGASTANRVGAYPINPSWNYGFGPLAWTPAGLLFHKPMFCDIYRNDPSYGAVGDGIFLLSTAGTLKKLYYYSNYEHCLSGDGQVVYFHEGRRIYGRRVDDPRAYDQGQTIVGYDRSGMVGNMVMGPAGDRLYYVSARGIEEMTLLAPANE